MQWRRRHANGSAAARRPYPAYTSALSRGCCGGFRFGSRRQQLREPIRIFPLSKRLRRLISSSPTRRLRLAVRTQPSHGWCTGSIPVGVAIFSETFALSLLGSFISRAALRGVCLGSGYRRYGRFDRGFQTGAVEGGFQLPNEVSFSGARDGKTAASEDDSFAWVEGLRLTSDARGQHTTRCHADSGAVFCKRCAEHHLP